MAGVSVTAAVLSLVLAGSDGAPAPAAGRDDAWAAWRFLSGEWVGEGSGEPGKGSGWFSFSFDLEGKILVRRNHSEYPATPESPAAAHDDLMVVYREGGAGRFAAVYFDNEGHVIHYTAQVAPDGNAITLLSPPTAASPGFRLIYRRLPGDAVGITFEIAPAGEAAVFKTYLSGKAFRKTGR